jgi:DNA-binding MarR family transcriptional regulator
MTRDSLDLIIDASFELGRVMRTALLKSFKDKERMNPLQIHAMFLISQHPGMTMKEFAKCLKVTSPSATVFASRLTRMGWIKRVRDARNRKLVRLRLMPKGLSLLKNMQLAHRSAARTVFGHLSGKDQAALASILKKLLSTPPFRS